MWCIVVFTFLISTQDVFGGYNYPKPRISFELPNFKLLPNVEGNTFNENNIEKTISYSLPYEGYQYLQEHKHKEIENGIKNIGSVFNSEKFKTQNNLVASLPTELNSQVTVSIETSNKPSPVLSAVNNLKIIQNDNEAVPPIVNLHNIKSLTGNQNIINTNLQSLDIHNSGIPVSKNLNEGSDLLSLLNIPLTEQHSGQISNVNFKNNKELSTSQIIGTSPNLVNNVITPIETPLLKLQNFLPIEQNAIHTTSSFRVQNNQEEIVNLENTNMAESNVDVPILHETIGIDSTLSNLEATISDGLHLQNDQPYTLNAPTLQSLRQNAIAPLITKSISFHVPPPDIEERPVVQILPSPKKIYKIIFIKVPSLESTRNIQLDAALNNRLNTVEDKTLIYVLVKKPEEYPSQIFIPQTTKPTEHEVLFVKYRGTPNANADEIKENIAQ